MDLREEKEEKIRNYTKKVSAFHEITAEKADQLLKEKSGQIVYIGRENCPFCQKFVDQLSPLAEKENLTVYYVDSKSSVGKEKLNIFREKYDVPTVPGLLYSSESAGLVVKCDSSLTEEEILEMLEVN